MMQTARFDRHLVRDLTWSRHQLEDLARRRLEVESHHSEEGHVIAQLHSGQLHNLQPFVVGSEVSERLSAAHRACWQH